MESDMFFPITKCPWRKQKQETGCSLGGASWCLNCGEVRGGLVEKKKKKMPLADESNLAWGWGETVTLLW